MLRVIRKSMRDAKMAAHLWPPGLRGRSNCCVKRLINHPWRVSRRLFNQRVEGAGKRIQGRDRAMAIRGMPRYDGLKNWSKKLSVMVSFRAQS